MQSLSLRIRWPGLNPRSGKVMLRRGLCGELPTKSSPRQAQITWLAWLATRWVFAAYPERNFSSQKKCRTRLSWTRDGYRVSEMNRKGKQVCKGFSFRHGIGGLLDWRWLGS